MKTYCICPECKRKIFLRKEEIEKYEKGDIVIIPCYDCGIGFDLQKGIHERNIKQ